MKFSSWFSCHLKKMETTKLDWNIPPRSNNTPSPPPLPIPYYLESHQRSAYLKTVIQGAEQSRAPPVNLGLDTYGANDWRCVYVGGTLLWHWNNVNAIVSFLPIAVADAWNSSSKAAKRIANTVSGAYTNIDNQVAAPKTINPFLFSTLNNPPGRHIVSWFLASTRD